MKRNILYIFLFLTGISFFAGCNKMEDDFDYNEVVSDGLITPYCKIEENGYNKYSSGKLGTKSLINQTTNTGDLLCNFLRLDQKNDSSFTSWNEAYISEGTVSSAHSHNGAYMRTVSLHPVQPYNNGIQKIRMIGWYPRTCDLPVDAQGNTSTTQYTEQNFSTYTDMTIGEENYVGVKFTGLDGSKDIMVTDVKDASFTYPFNSNSKFFTFKHYLSAIKIYAKAEGSSQDVGMWGEIEKVVVLGQPTSCTVALPKEQDSTANHVIWGNENAKLDIITTAIFGDKDNSAGNDVAEKYPISLGGHAADHYLGYMLVQPNKPLRIQIHTTAGVYDVNVPAVKNDIQLFNAGYIYEIHLNFRTDGTIYTFLGNEGENKFYDLTTGEVYIDDPSSESHTFNYKYANCYIIKSNPAGNEQDPMYDGFCFDATIAGNGEKGMISIGAQKLYPEDVHLKPISADIVWETAPRLITQVELIMGYVRFKVAKDPTDPNKFMEGNAVIAVYDENRNVLWSWHIWITDMPQEVSYTEGTTTITLLDRNLGATAANWDVAGAAFGNALETYGLYYQWGRKDPSMGPPQWNYSPINMITAPYYDYSSDTYNAAEVVRVAAPELKDAVENPMYLIMPTGHTQTYYYNWLYEKIDFLWGYNSSSGKTTKTIYDPCPYGYRVSGGELADLFNYASKINNAFTLSDYGQKVSVPTNSNDQNVKSDFYFPYTGYKGVDRGLNSLVCSWRYVGEKADYQSATVSTHADDPEYFMHRTRIYLSKSRTWSETGVGNYTGHQIEDHTNRKTAAPVRCVKNVELNRIMAFITPNTTSVPNTVTSNITFTLHAESFGVPITEASLVLGYHFKDNPEEHNDIIIASWNEEAIRANTTNGEGYIWNLAYQFSFADFINTHKIDLSNNTGELRFVLNVKNRSNVQKMSSTTIVVSSTNYIGFEEWDENNTVFTEEQINRVLKLYGDSKPVKVMMYVDSDATNAISYGQPIDISNNLADINSGVEGAPYINNWYCTTNGKLSFTTAGTYAVKFQVTYEGGATKESETKEFIVKGIKKITTVGEISADKQYVIKNVATGRYVYDGGTDVKAKANIDNTTTFRLPLYYGQAGVFQIRNVDTQQYVQASTNGNNGTLTITTTYQGYAAPFNINLNDSTNGYFVITRNNFYWKYDLNSSKVEYVKVNNNNQLNNTHRWEIYELL